MDAGRSLSRILEISRKNFYCFYLITWAYLTRRRDHSAYFVINRPNLIFSRTIARWHRIYVFLSRARISCFGFMGHNILAKSRRKSRQRCQVGAMKTIGSAPRGKVERNGSKECKDEEEGSSGSRRWGFRWYFFAVSCAKIDITACQSCDSSKRKHSSR